MPLPERPVTRRAFGALAAAVVVVGWPQKKRPNPAYSATYSNTY